MKKVYLVTEESKFAGWDDTNDVQVFGSRKSAKKYFSKRVEEAKREDHLFNLPEDMVEVEQTETMFCIYKNGAYSEDRLFIEIVEREVQ